MRATNSKEQPTSQGLPPGQLCPLPKGHGLNLLVLVVSFQSWYVLTQDSCIQVPDEAKPLTGWPDTFCTTPDDDYDEDAENEDPLDTDVDLEQVCCVLPF